MPSLISQRPDREKALYSLELAARERESGLRQASNATTSIDIPITPHAPAIPLKRIDINTREGSLDQTEATNGFRTYQESRFSKFWPSGRSNLTSSDKEDRPSLFANLDSWPLTVLVACGALLLIILSTLVAVHYCDLAEPLELGDEDHFPNGEGAAAFLPER